MSGLNKTLGIAFAFLFVLFSGNLFAQSQQQVNRLQEIAQESKVKWETEHQAAVERAQKAGIPVQRVLPDGRVIELQKFENGHPVYYTTYNLGAAETSSIDEIWSGGAAGLSLSGSSETLGVWDGGGVLASHQEFGSRVTQKDSPGGISNHATHVGGTMVAAGVDNNAKGMSFQADLDAYDWSNDESEMATAAANGLRVSNHSYGSITGWIYDYKGNGDWYWFGNTSIDATEDYSFGFYNSAAAQWDDIAYNAPNYLIVKSAGNDRNDGPSNQPTEHYIWDSSSGSNGAWVTSNATRDPDGGSDGFDSISSKSLAKNVLTVGAVDGIPGGYSQPSDVQMSSFSGWGPTDDGRIKPDIVAKGVSVYSSVGSGTDQYSSYNGTSMSSPVVSGTVGLLQEHYRNQFGGTAPLSSTMKALLVHTADEAGNPGPDYKFGWGLLNAEKAAELITKDKANGGGVNIKEFSLADSKTVEYKVESDGQEPLIATLAWTDPSGSPVSAQLDPTTSMLVNDLDVKITDENGNTYEPYVMDPANPNTAATKGNNDRDNVEQVMIKAPTAGVYTVTITHEGSITDGPQDASLILTGQKQFLVNIPSLDFRLTGLPLPATPNFVASVSVTEQGSPPNPALDLSDFSVTEDGLAVDKQNCTLTPPSQSGARLADVVFIVDNSGSMGSEQQEVIDNIIAFVDTLKNRGVDFALGLTRYGQSGQGTLGLTYGGPIFEDGGALTTDASYFKNDVLARNVTSGSSEPGFLSIEKSISNFSFRPGSQRVFVIITDERPGQSSLSDETSAINAAVSGDVTVHASTTTSLNDEFKGITSNTGGQIFDIRENFSSTVADAISQQVSTTYILSCKSPKSFDGSSRTAGDRLVEVTVTGNSQSQDSDNATYDPATKPIQNLSTNTLAKRSQSQPLDQNIGIETEIKSFVSSTVQKVELLYRKVGAAGSFKSVEMNKPQSSSKTKDSFQTYTLSSESSFYKGEIPDTDVQEPGMEFYVKVTDSKGTQTIPSSDPQRNAYSMAVGSNTPPTISHSVPSSFTPSSDLTLSAQIEDTTGGVGDATLYYRTIGDLTYKTASMTSNANNQYEATIPSSELSSLGVEYYIKAEDGSAGVVNTEGTADFPLTPGGVNFAAPDNPKGISFSLSSGDADISWDANTEKDLHFYKVYKGDDPDQMTAIDSVKRSSQNYSYSNAETDKTQFYGVTAVDSLGNESGFSELAGNYKGYAHYNNSWSMISIPTGAEIKLPAKAQLVSYSGGYQIEDSLKGGKGYWIKGPAKDSITVEGSILTETGANITKGWNIIGGLADTIKVNSIIDSSSVLTSVPIYAFNDSTYEEVSEITPSGAYWVYADKEGKIDLLFDAPTSVSASKKAKDSDAPLVRNLQELRFERDGIEQSIYMMTGKLSKKEKRKYMLPPVAPSAPLDVRIAGSYKIADNSMRSLDLTAASYPVKVTSDKNNNSPIRIEAIDGENVIYYDLRPGQSRFIEKEYDDMHFKTLASDEMVVENDLHPNYPNPFNPTTTISYELANKAEVTLNVFDVLGRKVQTLVNKVQQSGTYTVNFNASKLASGVYFVRLQTDSFSKIQKMTLIK
ncbi:S8 family serine peptidase [Fodinibius halophilus]|uniref:S8 family serine peptidase n=1 Tax=Fodinibius halophilus TaxID=1736908 RepID=A0A6M1T883_9BACT|nr:S8 family serine peptidase [Fodinibius halophilus]NGP89665.1 S8 family serine peptidase [Fodinibius halophilus]